MRKITISILLMVLTVLAGVAQTTIYAYRNWQNISGEAVNGPVKFESNNPKDVTLIADQTKLGNVYAGAYYNYKWYAQVTKPGTQSSVEGLYSIDLATGERTLIAAGGNQLADMTYDYATNTMYAIRNGAEYLSVIDLTTGKVTNVAAFKNTGGSAVGILALACNAEGQMYGLDYEDNFYTIDKATAVCTKVATLGVDAAFTQSMTFDLANNVLYWANNGDYVLYTIDVNTGKATAVGSIGADGADSLNSLVIPYINAAQGAPDRVTDRVAKANGKDVTLSWTNPAVDAQGNTLTELAGVKVYRNEELVATVTLSASDIAKAATYTDAGLADGLYSYKLVPFNSKGDGGVETDNVSIYVGKPAPGKVQNFTVTVGDSQAILNWTAPTTGANGEEFDASSITKYVINRISGTTSVTLETEGSATTYVDSPSFGNYKYSIYAVNEIGNGAESTSQEVTVKPADWIIMKTGKEVVEVGKSYKFYDNAGPSAYYSNSLNDTLVIAPNVANGVVKVEFTTFVLDTYGDYLKIFNGSSADAPIIGEFAAESVPSDLKSLESTSNDGALTFVFSSDIMDRREGWEATVTAYEKQAYDLAVEGISGSLYPEVNTASKYSVTIRNKGVNDIAGSEYKVALIDAAGSVLAEVPGADVAASEVAFVDVEFTPTVMGNATIQAEVVYSADGDNSNNKSKELAVEVLAQGSKFVEIGDATEELYIVPASFMSNESVSQTIFYASEIGLESGLLKMIAYPYHTVSTNYDNVPVKVYMAETDRTSLTDGNLFAKDMTLVFDGNVPVNGVDTEWTIQLTKEFNYTGKNLAIMVHKVAPNTNADGVTYMGTYGDSSSAERTRFDSTWDDSETLDVNAEFGWSASTIVPNITMLFTTDSGVKKVTIGNNEVKVYPNPVVSTLHISEQVVKAELISLSGQSVMSVENVNTLEVEQLPAGIYLLNAVTVDGKIIKEKIVKK